MFDGARLALALAILGLAKAVSGSDELIAAPDELASRVQTLLHNKYTGDDKQDRVARVLDVEKQIGAYRAARTKAEFVHRINADLWVATKDRRVCVHEPSMSAAANIRQFDLGGNLQLSVPIDRP